MKGIAKAILVGGFIVAAQAAFADGSGFPGSADDAGVHLPPNVTYASEHANDPVTSVSSAFPGAAPDGVFLPPQVTYADEHANDRGDERRFGVSRVRSPTRVSTCPRAARMRTATSAIRLRSLNQRKARTTAPTDGMQLPAEWPGPHRAVRRISIFGHICHRAVTALKYDPHRRLCRDTDTRDYRRIGRPEMITSSVILVFAAFLASAVEAVEALTVVLAMGVTRGWRSPLIGAGAALLALAAVVAVLGPALSLMPIDTLRVIVGTLLLVFGLQWLRKAILRAGGYKPLRDEEALYRAQIEEARLAQRGDACRHGLVWLHPGVQGRLPGRTGSRVHRAHFRHCPRERSTRRAGRRHRSAGRRRRRCLAHKPLSRVPENAMKFAVGLMLATFGIFWSVEGAGGEWPGADLAILGILGFLTLVSVGLRRRAPPPA